MPKEKRESDNIEIKFEGWDPPGHFASNVTLEDIFIHLYRIVLKADTNLKYNKKAMPTNITIDHIEKAIKRTVYSRVHIVIGTIYEDDLEKVKQALYDKKYIEFQDNIFRITSNGINHFDKIRRSRLKNSNTKIRDGIFISYSHKDLKFLNELKVFLKLLEKNDIITYWDDTKISPGKEWRLEIEAALNRAKIAILLVSPDFLASDFIMDKELPSILEATKNQGAHIVWVPIRSSLYKHTPIAKYQAFIDPNKPMEKMSRSQRNAVYNNLCEYLISVTRTEAARIE